MNLKESNPFVLTNASDESIDIESTIGAVKDAMRLVATTFPDHENWGEKYVLDGAINALCQVEIELLKYSVTEEAIGKKEVEVE